MFKFKVEFVIRPDESGQRPERVGVTVMTNSGAGPTWISVLNWNVDASQLLRKPPAAWATESSMETRSTKLNNFDMFEIELYLSDAEFELFNIKLLCF